mmetsp:Transcript_131004/g.379022  ORF Transcript_131004/g.379022 Transcript_131004/m.379022 type:complete len:311 (-) Transcript_131004:42-974(-)
MRGETAGRLPDPWLISVDQFADDPPPVADSRVVCRARGLATVVSLRRWPIGDAVLGPRWNHQPIASQVGQLPRHVRIQELWAELRVHIPLPRRNRRLGALAYIALPIADAEVDRVALNILQMTPTRINAGDAGAVVSRLAPVTRVNHGGDAALAQPLDRIRLQAACKEKTSTTILAWVPVLAMPVLGPVAGEVSRQVGLWTGRPGGVEALRDRRLEQVRVCLGVPIGRVLARGLAPAHAAIVHQAFPQLHCGGESGGLQTAGPVADKVSTLALGHEHGHLLVLVPIGSRVQANAALRHLAHQVHKVGPLP